MKFQRIGLEHQDRPASHDEAHRFRSGTAAIGGADQKAVGAAFAGHASDLAESCQGQAGRKRTFRRETGIAGGTSRRAIEDQGGRRVRLIDNGPGQLRGAEIESGAGPRQKQAGRNKERSYGAHITYIGPQVYSLKFFDFTDLSEEILRGNLQPK